MMVATHQRNAVWGSHQSLWMDSASKSPAKLRPRVNLAYSYQLLGDFNNAAREYHNAELLTYQGRISEDDAVDARSRIATAMGVMLIQTNQYAEAGKILSNDWNANPGFPGVGVNLSKVLIRDNRPDLALLVLDRTVADMPLYVWFRDEGTVFLNRMAAFGMLGQCLDAQLDFRMVRLDPDLQQIKAPCVVSH
jgi:predicted Zn-dependent protease